MLTGTQDETWRRCTCKMCEHGQAGQKCRAKVNGPIYSGHWRKCWQFEPKAKPTPTRLKPTQAKPQAKAPARDPIEPRPVTPAEITARLEAAGLGACLQEVREFSPGQVGIRFTKDTPLIAKQAVSLLMGPESTTTEAA